MMNQNGEEKREKMTSAFPSALSSQASRFNNDSKQHFLLASFFCCIERELERLRERVVVPVFCRNREKERTRGCDLSFCYSAVAMKKGEGMSTKGGRIPSRHAVIKHLTVLACGIKEEVHGRV